MSSSKLFCIWGLRASRAAARGVSLNGESYLFKNRSNNKASLQLCNACAHHVHSHSINASPSQGLGNLLRKEWHLPRTAAVAASAAASRQGTGTLNPTPRPDAVSAAQCLRHMSTSSSAAAGLDPLLPGNILRSPLADIDLPTGVSMHQMVFDACDLHKDRLAVDEFLTGRKYTYRELKKAAVHVASALYRKGYRKGDVLLAYSPNNVDFVVLLLACSAAGVRFSTANPAYTADELARQIHNTEAKGLVTVPPGADVAKKAAASKEFPSNVKDFIVFGEASGFEPFQNLLDDDGKAFPDVHVDTVKDVFILPYSSGTTGFPKGVMLSHYNFVSNLAQFNAVFTTTMDDRCLGLLPLFHLFGLSVNLFPALQAGASVTYLPGFEPESFLKCLQERKITMTYMVPPLILFLAKHPVVSKFDLTSIKKTLVGAAPLGHALMEEFHDRHPNVEMFVQGFGMTETSPAVSIDTSQTMGCVGYLVPNTLAKVQDPETNKILGAGEHGEICVKGPQVMLGYYKNQEATDNMITPDGWLRSGDIGYFNEDGLLFVMDRLKELIKYKGSQVAPAELEALLLTHPGVQDAAVVGVPDEAAGELPKAFVVVRPGSDLTEDQVAGFVEEKVSPWKKLRGGVQFLEEIPKSPSGKILRRVIKTKYL